MSTCSLLLLLAVIGPITACSSSSADDEYRVVKKTAANQLTVAVGEDARLFCRTNIPWTRCAWKPPRNGVRQLKCLFTRDVSNLIHCPSFPEVHLDVERTDESQCAIVVRNIEEHHEGNWKCEFEVDLPDYEEPIHIKDRVKLIARGWRYP